MYDKGGHEWYKSQFPRIPRNSSFITGEATPWYYMHEKIVEKMRQNYEHTKIIIVLRNPVDRAISDYYMTFNLGKEFRDISLAFKSEKEFLRFRNFYNLGQEYWEKHKYGYLRRGLYSIYLEKWVSFYPKKQLLVLKSDDLFSNPENTMRSVFHFLGLPEYKPEKYRKYVQGKYNPIDNELYQKLTEFYHPYNQELEDLLGMKFDWNKY